MTENYIILNRLIDERIVEFKPSETAGCLDLVEQCDDYFYITLTVNEIRLLGIELLDLAGTLESEEEL
jgi:hypothetical protein